MTKNEWKKRIGIVGRMLLAYAFIFGEAVAFGQGPTGQNKAVPPSSTEKQDRALTLKVKTDALEAPKNAAEGKESSRGPHEGITVHGYWTIEVKNPDGTVVKHVEFENSLDPGFTAPNPTAGQPPVTVPGGAAFLSALLGGQWAGPVVPAPASGSSAPGWVIALVGPAGLSNLSVLSSPNAPCIALLAACLIGQQGTFCGTPSAGNSCNLSVSPQGTAPAFTGVQLSGSVAATQNGQISTVATLISPLSCQPSGTACLPTGVITASFTSSTNFPGAPISVITGQTIAVTVTISFS
jgi:hypothetical protein